jgi:hypothetical protein
MLLHTLDERFPKGDIVMQGNHENREKKIVEPQSHMGKILTNVENMNIESQIMIIHHSKIHIIRGSTRHQGTT